MTSQGLEELDVDACLALLAEQRIGRIAFAGEDGDLVILPVNYSFDRGAVLVRTAEGSKLDAAVRGARVAFQIDGFDVERRTGWSVLVKGRCLEVWEVAELEHARALPLQPWAPGEKEHFLVVYPSAISGRRIAAGDDADPWWG